ncbi:MAG: hypothetical protein HYW65_01835 [Candidatus Liptonbacteria bacterium]|nr:hypothetical protein [Candidatus Liptonbacteria bacterium]
MDIKRLIAGFLVFAGLAAALALAIPSLFSPPAVPATQKTKSAVAQNAFLSQSGGGAQEAYITSSRSAARTPGASANLTQKLGTLLAQEVIRTNEAAGTLQGPPSGLIIPARKTLEAAIEENISSAAQAASFLPRFDEPVPDRELRVLRTPRAEDFAAYMNAAAHTLGETVGSSAFEKLLEGTPNMEAAYTAAAVYGNAAQGLARTPVPEPFVPLHKSILAAVKNRKALVDLALGDPSDPLKSLAALRSVENRVGEILDRDADAIEKEAGLLQRISFSVPEDGRGAFARLLGIERAFAQGAVVPVNDAKLNATTATLTKQKVKDDTRSWFQRLKDLSLKMFLQQLKNQLIAMLEQQIVNWINGGGSPQFITDWKGFLGNAFNNAVGAEIERVLPELCQPMSPLLRVTFTLPSVNIPVYSGCTLNQIVDNVKNFYRDFRNGGWIQYGVTFEPTGNYFGALIEGHDRATREALAALGAERDKAIAAAGFLSSSVCPSTGKPPDEKKGCPGGESPLVKTPGKLLGDAVSKAVVDSPFELIVNADDIAGLVQTVANAALNRLVMLGIDAASGRSTGKGLTSITPATAPPANTADSLCYGTTGAARTECLRKAQSASSTQGQSPLADQTSCSSLADPALRANCEATQREAAETAASIGEGGTLPGFESQPARVDLSGATASQSRSRHPTYDASAAIDGSPQTYSDTWPGSPSWWELTLAAPEYLEFAHIVTHGTVPLRGFARARIPVEPFLTLFEPGGAAWTVDLPSGVSDMQIYLNTEQARNTGTGTILPASSIRVNKLRIDAERLALATVELFRRMAPVLDLSKVLATLTKAEAVRFFPLPWATATYYPTYNSPTPAPASAISLVIAENSARGSTFPPVEENLTRPELTRYQLDLPGQYRFTYTVDIGGVSASRTRIVTVTE